MRGMGKQHLDARQRKLSLGFGTLPLQHLVSHICTVSALPVMAIAVPTCNALACSKLLPGRCKYAVSKVLIELVYQVHKFLCWYGLYACLSYSEIWVLP